MRIHACRFVPGDKVEAHGLPRPQHLKDGVQEAVTLAGDYDFVMMIQRAAWQPDIEPMHLTLDQFTFVREGWLGEWEKPSDWRAWRSIGGRAA